MYLNFPLGRPWQPQVGGPFDSQLVIIKICSLRSDRNVQPMTRYSVGVCKNEPSHTQSQSLGNQALFHFAQGIKPRSVGMKEGKAGWETLDLNAKWYRNAPSHNLLFLPVGFHYKHKSSALHYPVPSMDKDSLGEEMKWLHFFQAAFKHPSLTSPSAVELTPSPLSLSKGLPLSFSKTL